MEIPTSLSLFSLSSLNLPQDQCRFCDYEFSSLKIWEYKFSERVFADHVAFASHFLARTWFHSWLIIIDFHSLSIRFDQKNASCRVC